MRATWALRHDGMGHDVALAVALALAGVVASQSQRIPRPFETQRGVMQRRLRSGVLTGAGAESEFEFEFSDEDDYLAEGGKERCSRTGLEWD